MAALMLFGKAHSTTRQLDTSALVPCRITVEISGTWFGQAYDSRNQQRPNMWPTERR